MSQVLVQLVIKLVGAGSREQFRLQWLSEQRQERSASGKLFQIEVAAAETSTADGGSTGPRNKKSSGRWRTKSFGHKKLAEVVSTSTREVLYSPYPEWGLEALPVSRVFFLNVTLKCEF